MIALLLVHAAATLAMFGLIWFVQIVHDPLLARVGAGAFPAYEVAHTRLTTWVVAPLMIVEAMTSLWVLLDPPATLGAGIPLAGLALVLVLWLSTALLQVPCHRRLEHGFDADALRRLVRTNWIRTAAWTARGVLALAMVG